MTVGTLLKTIEKYDDIEIYDSDLPVDRNVRYIGTKRGLKNIPKEEYLAIRDAHVDGIFASGEAICIIAVFVKRERR
jgi:hypothetical protein